MWTPEDRALVGDFGAGQALTARLESRRTTDFRTSARNSGVHLTGFE
jgi:hypothetical protein